VLDGRVATAETDIGTLDTQRVALDGRVTTAEGSIGALDTLTFAHGGRLTTTESDIITLDAAKTAHDGRITATETNIAALQAAEAVQDAALSVLESVQDSISFTLPWPFSKFSPMGGGADELQLNISDSDDVTLAIVSTALQADLTTATKAKITNADDFVSAVQSGVGDVNAVNNILLNATQGFTAGSGGIDISVGPTNTASLSIRTQGTGQSLLDGLNYALRDLFVTSDLTMTVQGADELTLGVSPTIAGLDARTTAVEGWQTTAGSAATVGGLDARTTALEAAVDINGNNVEIASPNTSGQVGFSDSLGNLVYYYTEAFGTMVSTAKVQYRSDLTVFDPGYTPIRQIFQVSVTNNRVQINDSATNANYVEATGSNKTLTVKSGATLNVAGAATFASTITSSWTSSFRQGTATATTSTSDTQYTTGFTYREHVVVVPFGYTFASAPRVYVNKATQSASVISVCATNVTTTGFTLRALDVDAPTYFEVQWLAVL
jgi:hypothetical protein